MGKLFLITFLAIMTGCSHLDESKPSEVQLMINDDKQYSEWIKRSKSVDWNDLKKVHETTSQYARDYPNSAHAQYISAVMAGDYSETLDPVVERKIKDQSVRTLFSLLERLGEFRPQMRTILRNEFYYHSNRFLEQYLLGCEQLPSDPASGHFSIGVGGSEHAFQLLKDGSSSEALYFAKKAVISWQEHSKASPDWAYPYPYFYIQALMISGDKEKAYQELAKAKSTKAYLLKKPIYDKYEARLKLIENALSFKSSLPYLPRRSP